MQPSFVQEFANSDLPFFDGSMLIWSGGFIILSIFFSVMTWRSRQGFAPRALLYWLGNAALLCLGLYFFTKAFPRIGAGWVIAVLFILIFAISGATVATKAKSGDKKDAKEGEKK